MNWLQTTPDPLGERLSDDELCEVLRALGEAEFGGDERTTVGSVVEATGTDSETVLRILGEIRHRAIWEQQSALEAFEMRVARLEARPVLPAAEHVTEHPIVSSEARSAKVILSVIAAVVAGIVWIWSAGRDNSSAPARVPMYTNEVRDGTLTMYSDDSISVVRKDGKRRSATAQEEADIRDYDRMYRR